MNEDIIDRVVNAVLYEGYVLYPYRPSIKNRQRWTFGCLYPEAYAEVRAGREAAALQTECLVEGDAATRLEVQVRFLHLLTRRAGTPASDADEPRGESWQEASEREATVPGFHLADILERPREHVFGFPASRQTELIRDERRKVTGLVVREQQAVSGIVVLSAAPAEMGLYRVRVRVWNRTPLTNDHEREPAQLRALASTHTVLGVRDGAFVSLIDPPDRWREAAEACGNIGTWPVLVGAEGERNTLLSAPIILYDYPQVAPESPGDFFDATEIDEMLTLRILTLTDAEKQAMGDFDARTRALLDRTHAQGADELRRLHGALRPVPGGST